METGEKGRVPDSEQATLYERLGGKEAIAQVVASFYRKVQEDQEVSPYFRRTDMERLVEHQTVFVSFALGGPEYYSGQSLTQAHEGLRIAKPHFHAVLCHLGGALREASVGEADIEAVLAKLRRLESRICGDG